MRAYSPVYELAVALLTLALLAAAAPSATAQSMTQSGRHWISLGPELSTATAGGTVTYLVSVGTTSDYFAGDVLVLVPSGLTVIGQPECSSGCWHPDVVQGPTGSQIQTPVSVRAGESASFTFDVQIETTTAAGATFQLTAYLLGGVNTAGSSETAFATLQVIGPSASSTTPNTSQNLENEPPISFDPESLSVSPGETTRFRINLTNEGNMGTFRLNVYLPPGVKYVRPPVCFALRANECGDALLRTQVQLSSNGSTTIRVQGDNAYDTRFTFVFSVEIADIAKGDELTIDATVESWRSRGIEPVGEASIELIVAKSES